MALGTMNNTRHRHTLQSRRSALAMVCMVAALPFLAGCDDEKKKDETTTKVTINDKEFTLELALDDKTRYKGLSDRDKIADDGGMLFVFPDSLVRVHNFLMRDCPVEIDIIYLDKSMRVTATHAMKVETPQGDKESDEDYDKRLTKYSSRYAAQYVIEIKGGTLEQWKKDGKEIKEGARIEIDPTLKKRAKFGND